MICTKKNFSKKLAALLLIFSTIVSVFYAQEQDDSEVKEIQRFTIIEPVREHELNPQITSYSSDAQMLTGLYEGLFTYDPVSLSPLYAIATTNFSRSFIPKNW